MKIEQKSRFKPIEIEFHIRIETWEELNDLKRFVNNPMKSNSIQEKGGKKLNSTGILFLDFGLGVLENNFQI